MIAKQPSAAPSGCDEIAEENGGAESLIVLKASEKLSLYFSSDASKGMLMKPPLSNVPRISASPGKNIPKLTAIIIPPNRQYFCSFLYAFFQKCKSERRR